MTQRSNQDLPGAQFSRCSSAGEVARQTDVLFARAAPPTRCFYAVATSCADAGETHASSGRPLSPGQDHRARDPSGGHFVSGNQTGQEFNQVNKKNAGGLVLLCTHRGAWSISYALRSVREPDYRALCWLDDCRSCLPVSSGRTASEKFRTSYLRAPITQAQSCKVVCPGTVVSVRCCAVSGSTLRMRTKRRYGCLDRSFHRGPTFGRRTSKFFPRRATSCTEISTKNSCRRFKSFQMIQTRLILCGIEYLCFMMAPLMPMATCM